MKKIFISIGLITGLFSMLCLNSCKEDIDPIVDELDFTRAFTPVGLSAEISNITTVTLKWSSVKNADHYVVEIYEGTEFNTGSLVVTDEVPSTTDNEVSYSYVLPAGDTQFSARVQAVSSLGGVSVSKWIGVEFRSAPENLFLGYVSEQVAMNSVIIRWKPGSVATDLAFYDGLDETTYPITADELAAGEKELTGVNNALYEVRLMNTTFTRGRVTVLVEGDVLLASGSNLNDALDALAAGQVLVLENGGSYALSEVDTLTASVKIKCIDADGVRPKIFLATGGGNHLFDIDPSLTASDSLVFENIDISCSYDDAGLLKHRGVIDQELTAMHIGAIKFQGCIIRNSDRGVIRLRGHADGQVINTVEFSDCIIYDMAFGSNYGVVNPNAATASIVNISFTNSTVYHMRGSLVAYGSGIGCQGVVVDNCTFDRTMMDAAAARLFIDMGTGTVNTGAVAVSDCIFGQTSAYPSNGIRVPSTMTLSVTGSYYTSDYNEGTTGPIKSYMTAYSGASTALWKAPYVDAITPVDYSFLDASFAGIATGTGDPRWLD